MRSAGSSAPSLAAGPPTLLTVGDVAELLRTTKKAIYASIQRGQLPGVVRIGRRLLVDRATLLEWLASCRAPSPEGKT